jgi:hypothetical protein
MADLRGALLAAAEEAEKMQDQIDANEADLRNTQAELENTRQLLIATRNLAEELYTKNEGLKQKLIDAGELMTQIAETLLSAADL